MPKPLLPRPHGVPIGHHGQQITDLVRSVPAGFRVAQADDTNIGEIVDGQHLVYDQASGLLVPVARHLVFSGGVALNAETAPLPLPYSGQATAVYVALSAALTGDTTVTVRVGAGSPFATVTVPSGTTGPVTATLGTPLAVAAMTDLLIAKITAAGTGTATLTGSVLV